MAKKKVNKPDETDFDSLYSNRFFEARSYLLHDDPFYAQMVFQCAIEMNEEVKTVSIKEYDGTISIIYSEKWFETLTVKQAAETIKHVLNHLIYGHVDNSVFDVKEDDKLKMDVAQDLAVNSALDQNNLPKEFYKPSQYKLKEDLSTYEYFNQLPGMECKKKPQGNGKGDGKGKQGSGEGDEKQGDNHGMMESTVSASQLQKQTQQMVQQAHKNSGGQKAGAYGSGLQKLLKFYLQPPEIPWQTLLRQFISFASKVKKESTWKRPNRRFGEELQGTRKVQTLAIFIAVDESGSVSDAEWKKFLSEIEGIAKTKMCTMTICKFTTQVEEIFEYNKDKDCIFKRHSGGTTFQPFLDAAAELNPDVVVCLTDGENWEGDDIKYPRWNSVVWVLTPQHRKQKYGKSIVLKNVQEQTNVYW